MKEIASCRLDASTSLLRRIATTLALGAVLAFSRFGASAAAADGGIRFDCPPASLAVVRAEMTAYLSELGIAPELVASQRERPTGALRYVLRSRKSDDGTLDLHQRPELAITDEVVTLPGPGGKLRQQRTVSKKEILLAMLQRGRITEFAGAHCTLAALREHIAVRQNTAVWAERLNWQWPDGESAKWHRKYWRNGTPRPGVALHEAVNDAFMNQEKYSLGCYTAAKLVMMQGVLDYYRRIKKDFRQLRRIEARLLADREPLANVEPGRTWDFEADFDRRQGDRPGKILLLQYRVAARNFVPGDWVHIRNTDHVSYQKTGYEGSNPIYLGRNRFSDYYNDHAHAYSYREKLDQVFQWRNGVFSARRDAARARFLSERDIERLGAVPTKGGLVTDRRIVPQFFDGDPSPGS